MIAHLTRRHALMAGAITTDSAMCRPHISLCLAETERRRPLPGGGFAVRVGVMM